MIIIDGVTFNIEVTEVKRRAEYLYKYAKRVASGDLQAELIGVYFNYSISLGNPIQDQTEYEALWQKLTEPEVFHDVTVQEAEGTRTFRAYFAEVEDSLKKVIGTTGYYSGLTFTFIAKSPARTP